MRKISVALAIPLSASVPDAKEMFYTLASQWCSTECTNNKPSRRDQPLLPQTNITTQCKSD